MTAKRGLGRGLSSVIPAGASGLEELPVGGIRPSSRQPRRDFEEEGIADLAASIRQVGLLQPVVVRPTAGEGYELVVGERRWRAAQRAGLATIPAVIVDTDDRGAMERALVENIHRRDLNAIEEAAAYQQLIEEAGLTHEVLGERLGLSRPTITNALRLLDLPPSVQRFVVEGRLSAGHARALAVLAPNPLVERIAARVAHEGLSVRETEELVRRYKDGSDPEPAPRDLSAAQARPQAAGLLEASEKLSDALGTRVVVSMGKRKGKIVIEFGSVDDLERIYRRIVVPE